MKIARGRRSVCVLQDGAASDGRGSMARTRCFDVDRILQLCRKAARDAPARQTRPRLEKRSEEHTSELQSLMRISYAVFCLKKKNTKEKIQNTKISYTQNKNTTSMSYAIP